MFVTTEFQVLQLVTERLESRGRPFMLTGSFALAHYATPRMTRDLDIVVEVGTEHVEELVKALERDFYVDAEMAREAVRHERLFNLIHESGVKVDLIVRKSSAYRIEEFGRRREVQFGPTRTWIVSPEDLILSKLLWAQDSGSELQQRDVRNLLAATELDDEYLARWATELGVGESLEALRRG